MEPKETPHVHGTPVVSEPQNIKELWKYVQALEARVAQLEAPLQPGSEAPAE